MSKTILAIESSCDETSISIVKDGVHILSNVIASQIDLHSRFGGVVPEIACRAHEEAILPVLQESLDKAQLTLQDMDAIAVTYGPGLIGALLVGVSAAKSLAQSLDIPLIPVNHIESHVYANFMRDDVLDTDMPCVSLIVSGGNTLLVYVKGWGDYEIMGQTRDDAAGEAYDKVAKMMNLGYPGGPIIDQLAQKGDASLKKFPRARIKDNPYAFSFSGLKTAVLYYIEGLETYKVEDVAASFQEAVVGVLVDKTFKAAKAKQVSHIAVGGGVALNSELRKAFQAKAEEEGLRVSFPGKGLSADNAAMIAGLAYHRLLAGQVSDVSLDVDPSLPLRNWGTV